MGYPTRLFVDKELDEAYICGICRDVLQDPVITTCEHLFCKDCIERWLAFKLLPQEKICPYDRQPITTTQLKQPPRPLLNLLQKLKLHCKFDGCKVITNLGQILTHENICEANPNFKKACIHNCGAILSKIEIPQHNCKDYQLQQLNQLLQTQIKELQVKLQQGEFGRQLLINEFKLENQKLKEEFKKEFQELKIINRNLINENSKHVNLKLTTLNEQIIQLQNEKKNNEELNKMTTSLNLNEITDKLKNEILDQLNSKLENLNQYISTKLENIRNENDLKKFQGEFTMKYNNKLVKFKDGITLQMKNFMKNREIHTSSLNE